MRRHAAVIGGGIVGTATALCLQRAGHRVSLIDGAAADSDRASSGAAGVLITAGFIPVNSPGFLREAPGLLLKKDGALFIGWRYLPKLAPWLCRFIRHANAADFSRISEALAFLTADPVQEHQALAAGSPAARWIKPVPYYYVYSRRRRFEREQRAWQTRAAHGVTWRERAGEALRRDLGGGSGGLSADFQFAAQADNHGIITDPGEYLTDLRALFRRGGGAVIQGALAAFNIADNTCAAVTLTSGDTLQADCFAVTAGVYSAALLRPTGLAVPLEAERGYHLDLWHPSAPPAYPMLFPEHKAAVTPMHNRARIAGLTEFSDISAPPLQKAVAQLRGKIRRFFPAMTWQRETSWMGRRPAPADSVPVIGAHPAVKGLYMGFGHQHIGLTAAAKTARLLAGLMSGDCKVWSERQEAFFSPRRFS